MLSVWTCTAIITYCTLGMIFHINTNKKNIGQGKIPINVYIYKGLIDQYDYQSAK